MADGRITFVTALDNKGLEKELQSTKKKIQSLKEQIYKKEQEKLPLTEQSRELAVALDQAKQNLYEMQNAASGKFSSDEIKEQADLVRGLQQDYNKIENRIDSINRSINQSNISLDLEKQRAGTLAAELAKSASQGNKLDKNIEKSSNAMSEMEKRTKRFGSRLKSIVAGALVFNLISSALRGMVEWFAESIKSNEEARKAIAKLKGALLTLAEPLKTVLIPLLTDLVYILADISAAVAALISGLFGSTLEQSKETAEAIESVGDAAKKTAQNLSGLDEIKTFSSGTDSDYIAPDFDIADVGGLAGIMDFTIQDILFNWSEDITAENIATKIAAMFTMASGAIIGYAIGGVGGALIGLTIGAIAGVAFGSITFDADGQISEAETAKLIVAALGALCGGFLGFKAGGITGAAIGAAIGATIAVGFTSATFDADGKLGASETLELVSLALNALVGGVAGFAIGGPIGAAIGASVSVILTMLIESIVPDTSSTDMTALKKSIDSQLQFSAEATVKLSKLTGEVDSATIADFTLAKNLIDDIFRVDAKENKTAADIAEIKSKISLLNELAPSIGYIGLEFDEITGSVNKTKSEVEALLSSQLELLKFEAVKEQLKEAYKVLAEQQQAGVEACDNLTEATKAYDEATATAVQESLKMADTQGANIFWYLKALAAQKDAKDALDDATFAVQQNEAAIEQANETIDYLTQQVTELGGEIWNAGTTAEDFETASSTAFSGARTAAVKYGKTTISTLRSVSDEAKTSGSDFIENFGTGVEEGAQNATKKVNGVWEDIKSSMKSCINGIISLINGMISSSVSAINTLINGLNKISIKIPDWVPAIGGKTFGVNISAIATPQIPYLAQGAVIPPNREFLAVLGDQKHGTNIEAPLDTIKQAVAEVLAGRSGGNSYNVIANANGRNIFRLVIEEGKSELVRTGNNPFNLEA